jgi:hypothetical protein
MRNITTIIQKPIIWFAAVMIGISLFQTLKGDNLKSVIRSDGSGYYAFLPAIFIYQDGTFTKSFQAEKEYLGGNITQHYLYKDVDNNNYDKCFPGIAVLQAPFFGLACVFSWLLNQPITGYSDIFFLFYYLGSLFYAIIGLFLFDKFIRTSFPLEKTRWLVPLLYISSPLVFYCFNSPSYSHNYSFFLFGLFTFQVVRLKEGVKKRRLFVLGFLLGIIFLIRPTNLLILLMIPFILGDSSAFLNFIKKVLERKIKNTLFFSLGFFMVVSLLFFIWKWETGNWIIWTYNGEGFNFLSPQIFSCLLSYRIGLFLQIPLLVLSFFGVLILFFTNRFQAIFWSIYFIGNFWIFSSWWCWDFESPFGNRPYTEHLFFLLIPIMHLFIKYRLITLISVFIFSLVGCIRYYEVTSGYMSNQRFTKDNYFESLLFWKPQNAGRWNFTRSCVPFGKKNTEITLLNEPKTKAIKMDDEFFYTVEAPLVKPRTNERFAYRVELEKKITDLKLEGVYLIIDARNKEKSKRFYKSVELFNDKFEGRNKWKKLIFEDQILDNFQEYDFVSLYFWNQSKKTFLIRNCKIVLEKYKG